MSEDYTTLRGAAVTKLMRRGYSFEYSETVVDLVFEELKRPDRDMVTAGVDELKLAFDKNDKRNAYFRQLVQVIWAAMLDRAR